MKKIFLVNQMLVLVLVLFRFAWSRNVEVFLDHGGHQYHAEVFYSVAQLIGRLHPSNNITYVINQEFAAREGLDELFLKYGDMGSIHPFYYRFDKMPWYAPLAGRESRRLICHSDATHRKYWLRAIVTIANLPGVDKCLLPYANSSSFLFIIHHPTERSGGGGHDGSILSWSNSYVASNATLVSDLTNRHFSPALLPLAPSRPHCKQPPIFIVQGDPARRNFMEVNWMLATNYSFTIKLMNRYLVHNINDQRIHYIENSSLLIFHETFLHAAFILPLISPSLGRTRSYFYGRSTSSVAFGVHFRLRFLTHVALESTFHTEFKSWTHYWHDGSQQSFLRSLKAALNGYSQWCTSSNNQRWA
jgi:hypothetical protein